MRILNLMLLLSMIFCSCDNNNCKVVNCIAASPVNLRLIRQADNADLVFGPQKIYDKRSIRLYSLNGKDTIFSQVQFGLSTGSADSVLSLLYSTAANTFYLHLSATDTDTLTIDYNTENSACCKNIFLPKRIVYNGRTELATGPAIQTIRK